MGRKEGGGKLCKLHSGSDDENYIGERDRDKSASWLVKGCDWPV